MTSHDGSQPEVAMPSCSEELARIYASSASRPCCQTPDAQQLALLLTGRRRLQGVRPSTSPSWPTRFPDVDHSLLPWVCFPLQGPSRIALLPSLDRRSIPFPVFGELLLPTTPDPEPSVRWSRSLSAEAHSEPSWGFLRQRARPDRLPREPAWLFSVVLPVVPNVGMA